MSLEDIEFKNPAEVTKEMGDAVYADLFGEENQQPTVQDEPKPQDDAQSVEPEASQESELIEDIPNASIRLEKLKKQRDEERQQRADLEKELAEMRGKLSVLENKGNDADESDPTEYMDETQKFLFNQNKQLKEDMAKLVEVVQKREEEVSSNRLKEEENRFFENNPDLKKNKDEFVEDILGYLGDKPSIKKMLVDGKVSLGEVYGMYSASKPKSVKKTQVSNPDKVFSGHSSSVPANKSQEAETDANLKKAISILHDRESRNKAAAVNVLQKDIEKHIFADIFS
jgi:hypothetical protein